MAGTPCPYTDYSKAHRYGTILAILETALLTHLSLAACKTRHGRAQAAALPVVQPGHSAVASVDALPPSYPWQVANHVHGQRDS
jgi:hypothetical protein